MSFISDSKLAGYRNQNQQQTRDNIVGLRGGNYRDKSKPMVFLSHKHDEYVTLQNVIAFLKKEGVDVYVDWMDSSMPAYTNAETAHRLKEKIRSADKFILVATPAAINSKWCNWELGLGDAEKYIDYIALLPIDRTYESFKGSEYLKIYPRIEFENGENKYVSGGYIHRGYYVIYPAKANGSSIIIPLDEWLKKGIK